ncbi:MAG: hypothetical protein J6T17_06495 [Clostridia bacterium]|nr:hypothetical protein [Clostridia bacterium]
MMAALYKKVKDDTTTEILRKEWLAYLPLMVTGLVKKMTFKEYKDSSVTSIDTRPASEILAEVAAARKELKGG